MSSEKDTPNIDKLLQDSRWEDRVAEARVKRDAVLAAKRAAGETGQQTPSKTRPHPRSTPVPAAPSPRRPLFTVLAIIALVVLSAGAGALGVWMYQSGAFVPQETSGKP